MDGGNEPEAIPTDIDDDVLGNRIGMRKGLSQLGHGFERRPGYDAIPSGQRHADLRMAPGGFAQTSPRYDMHPHDLRHPIRLLALSGQLNLKLR
jgi:hypothetical protein